VPPEPPRILYSFPNRIGAGRICHTAWQQVNGLVEAGARVTVIAASVAKDLPKDVEHIKTTLAVGKFRFPVRLLGRKRAHAFHDLRTAQLVARSSNRYDTVHLWPLGSLRTLAASKRAGIVSFLERPNAYTRFAYKVTEEENELLGMCLPAGHDHQFNSNTLKHEEAEFDAADFLACPSDFVAETFRAAGFSSRKIARHHYGYDPSLFKVGAAGNRSGLVAVYAGVGEPRKGLHYALEAWLSSPISDTGTFKVCGEILPQYGELLRRQLQHRSVQVLGQRHDLPHILREADIFILSSIEEGSALVTYEARASGCVLCVSDATGAICTHRTTGLVHRARDWNELAGHLTELNGDRGLLSRMRTFSIQGLPEITWSAAGKRLFELHQSSLGQLK